MDPRENPVGWHCAPAAGTIPRTVDGRVGMVTDKIFEAALGVSSPWFIAGMSFEPSQRKLNIRIDFEVGSRFAVPEQAGEHPVHDTVTKTYRHLNFFQHECLLEVRVPRVKLPDGSVRQVNPPWAGKLSGFTLLFEAFVLLLAREMTFTGVARITGLSVHRVMSLCERYVNEAVSVQSLAEVRRVAIDETSKAKGHEYVSLFADEERRTGDLCRRRERGGNRRGLCEESCACIMASPAKSSRSALICGRPSSAASPIICRTLRSPSTSSTSSLMPSRPSVTCAAGSRRQTRDLKGMRWVLLKDRSKLTGAQRNDLDALLAHMTTKRTARAWQYREQLREILARKQPNIVRRLLNGWCSNVLRSKVEPMKEVAAMIRSHFEGILAWVHSRQTNGFLEAINGLFQAAKRKARGYARFSTIRTVIFLIAGKLPGQPSMPVHSGFYS